MQLTTRAEIALNGKTPFHVNFHQRLKAALIFPLLGLGAEPPKAISRPTRRPRRPRLGGRAPARRQLASRQPAPNWQVVIIPICFPCKAAPLGDNSQSRALLGWADGASAPTRSSARTSPERRFEVCLLPSPGATQRPSQIFQLPPPIEFVHKASRIPPARLNLDEEFQKYLGS